MPSIAVLLFEFFEFYAEVFPSYESIVDIRTIGPPMSKEEYFKSELAKILKRVEAKSNNLNRRPEGSMDWAGSSDGDSDGDGPHPPTIDAVMSLRRRRTWLAIADPFENLRLLGVSARGMERTMLEMRAALAVIRRLHYVAG